MPDSNNFKGKNGQSALSLFVNRSAYRLFAYSGYTPGVGPRAPFPARNPKLTYPIRNFQVYENFYYGRVDPLLSPVRPNKSKLKSLDTGIMVFDFVRDAFLAMKQDIDFTKTRGLLPEDNPHIADMEPLKAYKDINVPYNTYLESIQQKFYWYIRDNSKLQLGKEITSFETFSPIFTKFLEQYATQRTLSLGAFSLSSFYGSINNSGLAVEIADFDKSDDSKKYEFINNKCFPYYVKLASKYGFYIDYNVPWRLVADLTSPPMLKFREFRGGGGNLPTFFINYYTHIYYEEVTVIKNLYFKVYRDLVSARPWFKLDAWKVPTDGKSGSACRYSKVVHRVPITYRIFSSEYDNGYWLKKYIKIKNWESGNVIPDQQLHRIIKNSQDLEKTVDNITALRYINNKFRRIVATARGSLNDALYVAQYKDLETLPFDNLKSYLDEIYCFKIGDF